MRPDRAVRVFLLWAVMTGSAARGATVLVNGTFSGGSSGWTLLGGATVVVTGEVSDNPYARVPDGALAFLYQKSLSPAPRMLLSFDYFTGLMSPQFPSPGGFPDTVFATLYFGAEEAGVQPEVFLASASLPLFDFDAANGLHSLLTGATVTPSPARSGWTRFFASVDLPNGQPWFALTFQNLNANGTAADSSFLVDNVEAFAIPEPASLSLTVAVAALMCRQRRRRVPPATN